MSWAVVGLALAAAGGGSDGGVEAERSQLREQLNAQRAGFEALATDKEGILTIIDALQRLASASAQRQDELRRVMRRLARQAAQARAEVAQLGEQMRALEGRLGPRLLSMYRLTRQGALASLLSARDFAALVRRQRALNTVVEADVAQLDELATLATHQRSTARRQELLEGAQARVLEAVRGEEQLANERLRQARELFELVNAEQNRVSRLIMDLEASERELAALVAQDESPGDAPAFRALKGKLPFPAPGGVVEVGYGKVVNPRFNTVTVQKGIDVRAAAGAEVVAVAAGTVAYAGWLKGYGNLVILDHGGGYHSLYAHLERAAVETGGTVAAGQVLGPLGETGSLKGAYLYFEIRREGKAVDPQPWLAPSAP